MFSEMCFHGHIVVNQLTVEFIGGLESIEDVFMVCEIVEESFAQNGGIVML